MMLSASEKYEVIRLVEESELSVRRTLNELGVSRSSFYRWYKAYRDDGYEGLVARNKSPRQFWNKLPESVKEQCLEVALEHPELSPRELAWHITDQHEYFISESSVYRLLKQYDLITSPAYILLQAGDKFHTPTKRINELWQTDFTYFKIVGWGWYFLSTVLDDYSRYIISWKLTTTMSADDVKLTLDEQKIEHTRGAPYHPQTQGKIERYHRSMKNVVKLENYYYPWELEKAIRQFVDYYNHQRYHESLDNVTPADMFYGRYEEIMGRRQLIKQQTLQRRKEENLIVCSAH
jgi:transposase InsO family protein